ncbi:Methyltransferase domain-containing protein [Chryseobacterium taichungense]|uniref:Methyltransferase domain-containing protein n=1 Tax=Chryseobacterium taichungense TaxID=295069 RepID=A0A1H7WV75_9FLAO|nr:class I SAM-dependent methyltransferase [Chryseobacterium taichungense]SEM25413.1 Methyltransferase domain-containing protein [Chryseobacterium taichungense]
MKDTGERHIIHHYFTNKSELYLHLIHIATYEYAKKFVKDKKVLDYGCGSGYGSHMLSEAAADVTGVDISKEAVDFAAQEYRSPNLNFKTIAELGNEKFDIITSFQVIEHVPDDKEYTSTLKQLLNPGGLLIISTPDIKHRLFKYIQQPWNIFHLKEYTPKSLEKLLRKYFNQVEILKIGSDSDLVLEEIKRTRKQRIAVLPSTLYIYPYSLRVYLLNLQKKVFNLLKKIRNRHNNPTQSLHNTSSDFAMQYSHEDILFDKEMEHSTDLLAICKNE